MDFQLQRSPRKMKIRLALMVFFACAFIWLAKEYFTVRLQLKEAHGILADVIFGSWVTCKNLNSGNLDKALGCAITNQLKGIQYGIRREVKNKNLHHAIWICVNKGNLPLSENQHDGFDKYDNKYTSWSASGWLDDNNPLLEQFIDILYYYWPDSRERWTTWRHRDYMTNVKIGSSHEGKKSRVPVFKKTTKNLNLETQQCDDCNNTLAAPESSHDY